MKVIEAIELLKQPELVGKTIFDRLRELYGKEFFDRLELRVHSRPTASLSTAEGVLREMDEWIIKVALGVGLTAEQAERLREDERKLTGALVGLAVRLHNKKITETKHD